MPMPGSRLGATAAALLLPPNALALTVTLELPAALLLLLLAYLLFL